MYWKARSSNIAETTKPARLDRPQEKPAFRRGAQGQGLAQREQMQRQQANQRDDQA